MTWTALRRLTMGTVGAMSVALVLASGLRTKADEPDAKTPDLAFERVFLRDWGFYVAAPAAGKDGRIGVRYRLVP